MVDTPERPIEPHLDVAIATEWADFQHAQFVGHRRVVGIPGTFFLDLVRGRAPADQKAEREWIALEVQRLPDAFRTGQCVGETLGLLQREEPEREAGPSRDSGALAGQPIVERSREDDAEIGVSVAGRPPCGGLSLRDACRL